MQTIGRRTGIHTLGEAFEYIVQQHHGSSTEFHVPITNVAASLGYRLRCHRHLRIDFSGRGG